MSGHGGGDPNIVAEFVRYVREGGAIKTSPVAARYSVATGCMAAASVRENGTLKEVPGLSQEIVDYFTSVTD